MEWTPYTCTAQIQFPDREGDAGPKNTVLRTPGLVNAFHGTEYTHAYWMQTRRVGDGKCSSFPACVVGEMVLLTG